MAEYGKKKLKKIKKLVETNLTNRKTGCKLYADVTPLSPQEKMFFNENDGGSHRKKRKKHDLRMQKFLQTGIVRFLLFRRRLRSFLIK